MKKLLIVASLFIALCIIISLFIYWSSIFSPPDPIEVYNTTILGERKIRDAFEESYYKFAAWPTDWEMEAGRTLNTAIGIKNTDNQTHKFVINALPLGASQSVCPQNDITLCESPEPGKSLEEFMSEWINVQNNVVSVSMGDIYIMYITSEPPLNTQPGDYVFNIIACYDKETTPERFACTPESDNTWETPKYLRLMIK